MRVFISWSKPRSRALGSALRDWLPDVIQQVKPWMSQEDVPKGERWLAEISAQLDEVNHGIACVTQENVGEPWLNFEAGALAKSLEQSRLWTLLLDLAPTDVTGPLTTYQATAVADRDDMLLFAQSLNNACVQPLEEQRLKRAFDRTWPDFDRKIRELPPVSELEGKTARSQPDMVAETLERIRGIERVLAHRAQSPPPSLGFVRASRGPITATALESPNDLEVGCTVLHPRLGLGEVLTLDGETGAEEAVVRFELFGRKRLALRFAPLSLVTGHSRQLALENSDEESASDGPV